ncbi:MAG: glycosyltransferase family 2 protein [Anaerolineae bacterium]
MQRTDRVLIIVPAYNEADSIAPVVTQALRALSNADVLVVDDGSTDATAQVAARAGAMVLVLPFNLGIGGAVQTGYRFAISQNYRWVARIDGDGQHDPAQLGLLLQRVMDNQADLVIGSRHLAPNGYLSRLVCSLLGRTPLCHHRFPDHPPELERRDLRLHRGQPSRGGFSGRKCARRLSGN